MPRASKPLDAGGEFGRPQQRYDDIDIIISEVMEGGYDSERGAAAFSAHEMKFTNAAKLAMGILYVLSAFVYELIRWVDRFSWRRRRN